MNYVTTRGGCAHRSVRIRRWRRADIPQTQTAPLRSPIEAADYAVQEYLDHNELGLAFEVLATAADAAHAAFGCCEALVRAAREMGLRQKMRQSAR